MSTFQRILKGIDFCSHSAGHAGKWFAWVLVLAGAYDTIARHFFNAPTMWAYDVLCMSGGALYALGWSYDQLHNGHIRVDLFYRSMSDRKKAFVDVLCSLFFFFPLMTAFLLSSVSWASRAWRIGETMTSTFWYPPAAPYRTVFAIGVFLLILQGLAKFIRDFYFLTKGESLD